MYTILDENNYYLGVRLTEPTSDINYTEVVYNGGLIKPKFENGLFVEGATEEEIAQAQKLLVPQEVPLWAMIRILKRANVYQSIINVVNTFDEPLKSDVLDFLALGNFVKRNSDAVLLIQSILQKTDAQVDKYFIDADALNI